MIDNNPLVSDNADALVFTAQSLAMHQGKPFYIAKSNMSGNYKITSLIPHSPAWRKEKLEWVRTIMPTEK